MKLVDFDGFCGPTYLTTSPFFDAQRAINFYPEPGIATSKGKAALIGRPGFLTAYVNLGHAPVRLLWAGDNRLFAAGGTNFYEIGAGGTAITDYGAMAGSSGNNYCTASANGTQLLVYDSGAAAIFNANAGGPSMDLVLHATALEYLDGYYVAIATGASLAGTNPNQINVSDYLDGTTWNPLNFVLRTGAADLTTQLAVLNGQLWIFGQKTIEVWYNAGNPLFPFARIQGADINLGLMSPGSVVKFYNTLMWLGSDDRGYAQVYMAQGLNPVRVSNFAIEQYLAQQSSANLGRAWAYAYQENGHTFYCLTILDSSFTPLIQVVYDLTTGLWHERTYAGSWPICFASVPGFLPDTCNFVGDGLSGGVFQQSTLIAGDAGNAITYTRRAPHLSDRGTWKKYAHFELFGQFGSANPKLQYSDDGGLTFGPTVAYTMQQAADSGRPADIPTYRRYYANQLGRSRDRVFQVQVTTATDLVRIADAYLGVGE